MPPKKAATKKETSKAIVTVPVTPAPTSAPNALGKLGTEAASQAKDAAVQVAGQLQDAGKKTMEVGQKAISNFGGEVVSFEKKIMQLPIDRRVMFFAGVVVLLSVFLSTAGLAILIVLGLFMIISGIKGNDIFLRLGTSEEKKK
jgi:hypothetical protein